MDKINEALEGLQKTLDQKAKDLSQKMSETNSEHAERIGKVQEEMIDLQQKMRAIEAAAQRPTTPVDEVEEFTKEYKSKFDQFLRKDNKYALENLQQKMMSTVSDADGGFLVPRLMSDTMITRIFETSPMRQLANVVNIGTKSIEFPIDDNELTCAWGAELDLLTDTTTPKTGKLEITAHELYARPSATSQMLEDSQLDIQAWLAGKVADKFSRTQNTAFVNGSGVGQPQGFLTYSNYSQAGVYERNKVEQIASGSDGAITADSLISLQNSLKEAYQSNGTFLLKRSSFGAIKKLKSSTNEYLLGLGLNGSAMQELQLLGRPVVFADDMPAISSGSLSVAYGDFRSGYQIVDRLGIVVIKDSITKPGQVIWNFRTRLGGAVSNSEAIKLLRCSAS